MIDEFGRPDWDSWFMALCFTIARKSIDPSTKHGCIAVAPDKTILSIGYNGPLRNAIDNNIPLTRPEKYPFLPHSESNCVINAARNGISLNGCTFYVTGFPCESCFAMMVQAGAKKIIYGPQGSHMINDERIRVIERMKEGQKVELIKLEKEKIETALKTIIDAGNILAELLRKSNESIQKNT